MARKEVKEFEASPKPWSSKDPERKVVHFDPNQGPAGKAIVKAAKREEAKDAATETKEAIEGVRKELADAKATSKTENKKTEKAKKAEKEKPKKERIGNLNFTDEQIIAATKKVGHPATSREVSDALGIKDPDEGRAYIRRNMERLTEAKKIVSEKPPEDQKGHAKLLYRVA